MAEVPGQPGAVSRMSVHQIWAAVVTVLTIVAAVVVLSIEGKDATTLMLVVTAVGSPVISALVVTQKLSMIQSRVDTVDQKVDGVDTKVNGHMTEMVKKIPNAADSGTEES